MKKIIFLTGYSISHIYPLETMIKFLKNKYELYIICTYKNKWLLEKWGVNVIIYPEKYWKCKHENKIKSKREDNELLYQNESIQEKYISFLQNDALSTFNFYEDVVQFLKKTINEINPSVVFKDSTDIYWDVIRKEFNSIKTIGFITNNLYSWKYLQNKEILLHFLGILDIEKELSPVFIDNFKDIIDDIYKQISLQLGERFLRSYYQYDPQEEVNIIFSMPFFQPIESLEQKYNNYIVTPQLENFTVESIIPQKLITFIGQEKVIYISTGSFITKNIEYYIKLIQLLTYDQTNKIIISGGKQTDEINKYILENSLEDNAIVFQHVPQKYVLSNCKLFISTGGFNSVKEAIYFKVPMLVIPITCEQRLNGLIIEKLGIGHTLYKRNQKTIDILIKDLLDNESFSQKLQYYSNNIIDNDMNYKCFKEIEEWITNE